MSGQSGSSDSGPSSTPGGPPAQAARRGGGALKLCLLLAGLLVASAVVAAGAAGRARRARSLSGLSYSTARNDVVQHQPAPGSCHAIGSGLYSRPDPRCTPGALNPRVIQATIGRTICRSGWTSTARPPESVTEREKRASLASYGDWRPLGYYEYDHFVPLELGGATNAARNLWPEPGATPNPKDEVENRLRRAVCDRQLTLAAAQRAIVTDWVSLARGGASRPSPPRHAASCSVEARYDSAYTDYDVYVHSDQPDRTVTVTGAGGRSATWHTNSSGYADVYFHASRSAAGARITVRVGAATCSTTL